MRKKVVIPTKLSPVAGEMLTEQGDYEVFQEAGADLLELAKTHGDAYAFIVRSEKVTPEIIDAYPNLKVVIRAGAGFNTIDIKYARKRKIDVMNTPGANSNAVAEEVVALMLADARHLIPADASCRSGKWEKAKFMGREITEKTIGILGLGHIGQLVAKRLSGFDMTVVGYDPVISEEKAADVGARLVSLEELFEQADYISLHIPENDATRGMINKELFDRMKEGASVINCARAGIINEDDLRAAKAERGIRYLNDVYPKDEEGDKPIADVADIMLPHLGASTVEANTNAAVKAAKQLIEFDTMGITSAIVNRDIPAGLDESYAELAFTLTKLCRSAFGDDAKISSIETSVYGALQPYAEWLIVPILTALYNDFERSMDHGAAQTFLDQMGIAYLDRTTDERKGYGDSITIDLVGGCSADELRRVSVRGTIAENVLMVSRINDFDRLYVEPQGHMVVFIFADRPGVLAQITQHIADAGLNIEDVRNPHNEDGGKSIAILKVNEAVSSALIDQIAAEIEADTAFYAQM